MAEAGTSDILPQIQFLVTDRLQVVTYKWLSRSFSISSNDAKRLLQSFVKEHGSGLEVVYTLAGWSKEDPQAYHIRLVPGFKLPEVKQEFKDYSIQVYSVQACTPKDPAVLWSAEYVQTEELFDQPQSVVNCLRDNRFCGISNSFVTRNLEGKPLISASVSKKDLGNSLSSNTQQVSGETLQPQKPNFAEQSTASAKSLEEKSTTASDIKSHSRTNNDKEKPTLVPPTRMKGNAVKGPATNGGSLANLWGRASARPKTSGQSADSGNAAARPSTTVEVRPMSVSKTSETINSDDEDQTFSVKREPNSGSGRKRKVVFDFSDDEDGEENIVSLSSPEPPVRPSVSGKNESNGHSYLDTSTQNEERNSTKQVEMDEMSLHVNLKPSAKSIGKSTKSKTRESSLLDGANATVSEGISDITVTDVAVKQTATTTTKLKKVLKTRVDEKGREVTEVVWEGQAPDKDKEHGDDDNISDKNKAADGAGSRLPVSTSATPSPSVPSNVVNKPGNKKTVKGPQKDVKQGNILSFFKKV